MRQVIGMLIDTGARLLKEPKVYKTLGWAEKAATKSGGHVTKVVVKHRNGTESTRFFVPEAVRQAKKIKADKINPKNALGAYQALEPSALLKKINPQASLNDFESIHVVDLDDTPLLRLEFDKLKPDSPWDAKIDYYLDQAKKPVTTIAVKQTPDSAIFKFTGKYGGPERLYRHKPAKQRLEFLGVKHSGSHYRLVHHSTQHPNTVLHQDVSNKPKLNPQAFERWDHAHSHTNGVFPKGTMVSLNKLPKDKQLPETLFTDVSEWRALKKAHPGVVEDLLKLLYYAPDGAEFRININRLTPAAETARERFYEAFNRQSSFLLTHSIDNSNGKRVLRSSLIPKKN